MMQHANTPSAPQPNAAALIWASGAFGGAVGPGLGGAGNGGGQPILDIQLALVGEPEPTTTTFSATADGGGE
eukprot:CAMPEP_0115828808 /NCGR_PEP_ID=MMETSP0287-20121206/766_1 /TAXON_ID=412157 /ORGANISM="Chrysochromulina rotalis, Strain UIO044" /LENGTH=71 /DNA_ID=CAMNT_0003282039 /DNA_START=742 /DNA_END=957 /DNA_ORIENTATION=-